VTKGNARPDEPGRANTYSDASHSTRAADDIPDDFIASVWRDKARAQATTEGLTDVPAWALESPTALHRWKRERDAANRPACVTEQGPEAVKAYVQAALDEETRILAETREGGRNDQLNKTAFALGQFVGAGVLDRATVERELETACRINNYIQDDGIRAFTSTLNSGLEDGIAEPRDVSSVGTDAMAVDKGSLIIDGRPVSDGCSGDPFGSPDVDTASDEPENTVAALSDSNESVTTFSGTAFLPEPTTWEPVDLGPYLRGEVTTPEPTVGLERSDGQRLVYPGREHAILGPTESGKTWFVIACAIAEMRRGNNVLYVHYEEADATSTIERLRILGVPDDMIRERFQFVAPMRPVHQDWLAELLAHGPSLVVHDGVNEAMALHGAEIKDAEGASAFRRRLILPCTRAGAATLACDHLPMVRDGNRLDAYGSVHKGNALDGARIVLENSEPFGRGMRGVSYAFVTKDRPGHLRANGRPTKTPGKTFIGALVVDDSDTFKPLELALHAPRDSGAAVNDSTGADDLPQIVLEVIAAQPGQAVGSLRQLLAHMRAAGHPFRDVAVRDAADILVAQGRLQEVPGKRGATGYSVTLTASREVA
jgi:hypothetical protein